MIGKENLTIVVGAGLAGAIIARRIKSSGGTPLIIEKRSHIGGNVYDYIDGNGLLLHKYGAHIFHTNYSDVWDFLSRFTEWHNYRHKVLVSLSGNLVNIPFNLNSLYRIFDVENAKEYEKILIDIFGENSTLSIFDLYNQKGITRDLGKFIYEKIYLNYTIKQWELTPQEIDNATMARVPIRINTIDDYFDDRYQGIPQNGYTAMINNILKDIDVQTNTDALEKIILKNGRIYYDGVEHMGKLYWTASLDALFRYKYGVLPYRTLSFEIEQFDKEYYQPVAVVNYPNEHKFTRIIECKHMTGQMQANTTIMKEYPQSYRVGLIECYPIITRETQELYQKYYSEICSYSQVVPIGRLAEYKYYDMDDVVKRAIDITL